MCSYVILEKRLERFRWFLFLKIDFDVRFWHILTDMLAIKTSCFKNHSHFCDQCKLQSEFFYQILLTWWKTYYWSKALLHNQTQEVKKTFLIFSLYLENKWCAAHKYYTLHSETTCVYSKNIFAIFEENLLQFCMLWKESHRLSSINVHHIPWYRVIKS